VEGYIVLFMITCISSFYTIDSKLTLAVADLSPVIYRGVSPISKSFVCGC